MFYEFYLHKRMLLWNHKSKFQLIWHSLLSQKEDQEPCTTYHEIAAVCNYLRFLLLAMKFKTF